ncbi:histidine kinase [Massilia sp. Root351]|jgi:signal transduction histidine kinase/CheY-like chemotaxis protein|uniref:hybrid sensor histidine kinase/response regulator n=1 Tax=Massilia sp. Root351 TaxID=1736522 RepID=UPI00070B4B32|nr:response regulator [Massilia sp. Root351]KQV79676.1 histidine kinase [Massilia sp. Root351]
MFSFERSGLSRKLTLISALSTGGALLLAFAVFATTHVMSQLEQERRQLYALAGSLAAGSDIALLYVDPAQGEQALAQASFEGRDDIRQVALFDRDGRLLSRISPRHERLPPPDLAPGTLAALGKAGAYELSGPLWAPGLRQFRGVHFQHDQVGAVMVEAGLPRMWRDVLQNLAAGAAAALLSSCVALLLARRFRDNIAEPIANLIAAARQTADGQPGAPVLHARSDELGALIDSFNDMLVQVASRDAKLAQYRDQLERQVGVRTEQLEKAKNAAEAASRAKSNFLATMSHEIRTPMNGVLGMTELLLASPLTAQQRHYTSMVKRSGEHLLFIINDILDFSKIEAGKLTVEYIHFNFRELLDDIDNVFSPQAQAKRILLEFIIANDIPVAICGDPNRLRQVLFNLLGNAIKFTETGKITVKVHVASEDAQAVGLRFEVHDSGIGVAREARARIFDSFSQADGSTTRKHGGTGLGLAISKQLVELMGGTIGVDHALTQGSIFWFAVQFDKRRVEADDASFEHNLTLGMRALIVDHHSERRMLLERQLARWQLHCDSAAGAEAALRMLHEAAARGHPYDVALLDMDQRLGSGLMLAAEIKADPAIAAVRLLLLSDERNAADTRQRREAGVAFQLIKPPRACDLYDCVVSPARGGSSAGGSASQAGRSAGPAPTAGVTAQAARRTAAAAASAAPPAAPLSPAPGAGRPRARQRNRVLLAEDNPVNVEVASAMLHELGLDVSLATNGAEALDAVRENQFDLVLMDCQMPVMDGMAATAEIRRREQQRGAAQHLPVVAITANAMPGDRETCLAAGMDDYLSKPFTQQGLGATLAHWIALPLAATLARDAASHAGDGDGEEPGTPMLAGDPAGAAAAAAPATINAQALDYIRALRPGQGGALLQRVLQAFLADTPRHLAALRVALQAGADGAGDISEGSAELLRRTAHSLKSSSANVGADALAALCKELEHLASAGLPDGALPLLSGMEREFDAVRQSLRAILEKEA